MSKAPSPGPSALLRSLRAPCGVLPCTPQAASVARLAAGPVYAARKAAGGAKRVRVAVWTLGTAALLSPSAASACSVCFGVAEGPVADGINAAILTLLGFVGLIFVGIVKLMLDIRKRTRALALRRAQFHVIHGGAG